jgi:large subunit ribosomal protein L6
MVEGVTQGYKKQLEITGVGYKAEVKPFGCSSRSGTRTQWSIARRRVSSSPAPQPIVVVIEGADKEKVGQVAAEIRALRKAGAVQGERREVSGRADPPEGG